MPDDESMYEYYADPDNRVPDGPGRRRASKPLTTHVPIRFSPEVVAQVKQLADLDRKTVSSWIRDVVDEEVERRRPHYPQSVGLSASPVVRWFDDSGEVVKFDDLTTVADAC
jgi:hypothetical protein